MILNISWITIISTFILILMASAAIAIAVNIYAAYKERDWNNALGFAALGFCFESGLATLRCLITGAWGGAVAGGIVCLASGLVIRFNLMGATR